MWQTRVMYKARDSETRVVGSTASLYVTPGQTSTCHLAWFRKTQVGFLGTTRVSEPCHQA